MEFFRFPDTKVDKCEPNYSLNIQVILLSVMGVVSFMYLAMIRFSKGNERSRKVADFALKVQSELNNSTLPPVQRLISGISLSLIDYSLVEGVGVSMKANSITLSREDLCIKKQYEVKKIDADISR